MKALLLQYKYLIILIVFAILTHLNWFNPFSILTYSDWYYWPNEAVKQLFSSYGPWVNFWNFGSVNIQLQFNVFKFFWALLTNIGLSYDQAVKITFLFPIAILGFLSPYFLSKKLFTDNFISFTTALFYGTTTHFLIRQTSHIPIAFIYSITPIILLLFIYTLEKNKPSDWILFSLLYSIGVGYETRIMYIVTFILFFYFLFFHLRNWNNFYKNIIMSSLIIVLLNSFWILPLFLGGGFNDASAAFNRGLFGNHLFSLTQAFTIFESSWTGAYPNMDFITQKVVWYFWIFPIVAFSALIIPNKNQYKKGILFFSFIALLGIVLSKQSSSPFPSLYLWMYDNFPGFNMFREASKFYLLTTIGYLGLIGYSLVLIKKMDLKRVFHILAIIIIITSAFNAKPLITGEIGTMFVPREIPNDYLIFKDYISEQPDYFRTLSVPTSSRWTFYINNHPKASIVELIQTNWKSQLNYKSPENILPINEQIINAFHQNVSDDLLDVSSIKYVVIPIQDITNEDDFFRYYGKRDYFIQEIRKINHLNEINIGTEELLLFENQGYLNHIYTSSVNQSLGKLDQNKISNVNFEFVNPTEYKIRFDSVDPFYLYFSEAYHPDWILAQDFKCYKKFKNQHNIFDGNHFKAYDFLNGWYIDPNELTKNKDGIYELTLYFKTQSYFYIGLIISGLAFIGCVGYLVWDFKRKRRDKKINELSINFR